VFAVLIVLSVIGIGLHAITKLLARKVTFWSESFIE
jgi:ABC-type nitrate/sulfonate/bicarbonate transport system permease component